MKNLTPHQRIIRAAQEGKGARFTAEEVRKLARDDAIRTTAASDDEQLLLRTLGDGEPEPDEDGEEEDDDA